MTDRLYYTNAYLKEFDATVLDVVSDVEGRAAAILDRTAFYPTSGGQPFDTGALGDSRVVDVVDRDDGVVLHIVEGKVLAGPTHGRIDWDRRFEHMQQHTGQHVLSAAFERTCQARTSSFHLGTSSATIDLAQEVVASSDRGSGARRQSCGLGRSAGVGAVRRRERGGKPAAAQGAEAQRRDCESWKWMDSICPPAAARTCRGRAPSATSASARSSGFAAECASSSGAEFVRWTSYRLLRDTVSSAARLLSTGLEDLPAATERLQGENNEGRRRVKHLQEKLAGHEASVLAERPENRQASTVIEALDGWDANGLKAVASAIVERAGLRRHSGRYAACPFPSSLRALPIGRSMPPLS